MIATFTATEVILIMVAVGTLATTIGGVIVSIINANRIAKVDKKVESVEGKVNGAATASKTEIQGLRDEIKMLVADRAEKKEEAALLAASKPAEHATVIVANTPENPVPVLPTP